MAKKVQTVCGQIDPSVLGVTLTHEHVSIHTPCYFLPPKDETLSKLEWSVQNVGWIRQNPYGHEDNLRMNDALSDAAVMHSVQEFKNSGGGTLVENSVQGLYRRSPFMKEIANQTGVNIVAGTGFYVDASIDEGTKKLSEEELASVMTKELTEGCVDDPTIKCGMIGEVGVSWPITDFEMKSIRASAKAQEAVGCGVSFHPGRNPKAPEEILRIFLEAGGKANKTVMSHLERTFTTNEQFHDFADLGSYCQLDLFGIETSYYQLAPEVDFPSDAQRMDFIKFLLDDGSVGRILMAQDIHTKHRLEHFGGHGYSHILKNVIPKMMNYKDISQDQIDSILKINPGEFLAF